VVPSLVSSISVLEPNSYEGISPEVVPVIESDFNEGTSSEVVPPPDYSLNQAQNLVPLSTVREVIKNIMTVSSSYLLLALLETFIINYRM